MKIFLTGATGLIGAHTALALLEAGHTLRLLVRNKQLAKNYFFKHGYQLADDTFIEADMRDAATLRTAMQGCDAVLHAAAMVSLDPKKAEEIYRSNIDSIDAVDMMVKLKEITGKRLDPDEFKDVRTVSDCVDAVSDLLSAS